MPANSDHVVEIVWALPDGHEDDDQASDSLLRNACSACARPDCLDDGIPVADCAIRFVQEQQAKLGQRQRRL